ncbi:tRNA(His) guanylyltransferase Thg1 family protein [Methanospirillum lacunae]|uniref:tRNA(His) guanylyltransferase n=1 Tax=Methanospirillum lacunae TaxID=668570 RepID=A0A2V2NEK5_9EURY|nr:tRNA(His) guanylyltransferase Thg1 family protein [Methanospirillum lacunae]PWR74031.1 tRNA 5'-guanylyltransferase [Methanospirillum lacunae]
MKEREIYTGIKALAPVIIRLDGRAFHQFLAQLSLKRPFDEGFSKAMVSVCTSLLTESGLSPLFAYTFSDEISIYLDELPFEGRVEKLTSVIASIASSCLTMALKPASPISFDARIIPVEKSMVADYLNWRQKEAWRNHINGYTQVLLLQDGLNRTEVQRQLNGVGARELHEICFQHGVNLAQTPSWERRGIMVYHTLITKEGYNPVTKEKTIAIRRKVYVDRNPPVFSTEEGKKFVEEITGS